MEKQKDGQKQPAKGADQKLLGERYGKKETGPALHPASKESGRQGASNAGEDESSGSE